MEWISDCEFKAATRLRCLRGPAGLGAYICLYMLGANVWVGDVRREDHCVRAEWMVWT